MRKKRTNPPRIDAVKESVGKEVIKKRNGDGGGNAPPPPPQNGQQNGSGEPQELDLKEVIGKLVTDLDSGIKASFVRQTEKLLENLELIERIDIKEAKELLVDDDDVKNELKEKVGIDPDTLPRTPEELKNLPEKVKASLKVLYGIDLGSLLSETEEDESTKEILKEIREIKSKLQNLTVFVKSRAIKYLDRILRHLGEEVDEEIKSMIQETVMEFAKDINREIEVILNYLNRVEKRRSRTTQIRTMLVDKDISRLIVEKVKENLARKRLLALREAYSKGIPQILPVQGKVVFKAFIEPDLEKSMETQRPNLKIRIKPPSRADADRPEGKGLSEIEFHFRIDLP